MMAVDCEPADRYWVNSYRKDGLFCLVLLDRANEQEIIETLEIPVNDQFSIMSGDQYQMVVELHRKCVIFNRENEDFHLYDEILHEYLQIPYNYD